MKYSIFITIFVLMTLMSRTEARSWTSRDGKTIEAEYVKVETGLVWLRGPNGREVSFPYNAFSEEDQGVIMSLYKEGQEKIAQEKEALRLAVLEKWKPGQIIKCVTTDKTASSYHVYIPTSFDPDNPPPLLYAFSPGGDGRGQLNAMKKSAEKA